MDNLSLPLWVDGLTRASTSNEWLAAIADVEDAAVQGLLRRKLLPDTGRRSERLQTVQRALDDSTLNLGDLDAWRTDVFRVIDAVDAINDFGRRWQLVHLFIVDHGLHNATIEIMLGELRDALWRGDIPLESWVRFLDPHHENADRDLFLYRISSARLANLRSWRDPDEMARELQARGFGDVAEVVRFVWLPSDSGPELVAASYDAEQDLIRLQWVSGRDAPASCSGTRRCLAFARLHCGSGDLELQVQHVDHGGMRSLVSERDQFVRALHGLLGEAPASVRLEPAMRALMTDRRLALDSWRVRLPTGGVLSGRHQGDLFAKVRVGFDQFYALEIAGRWKPDETISLSVRLDSRADVVVIREQCATASLAALIALVRAHGTVEDARWKAETRPGGVRMPPPDIPDLKPSPVVIDEVRVAELRATVEKLVDYLRRLGHDTIAVEHLASRTATGDLLLNARTLQEALDSVGVRSVGAILYVVCPSTLTPVKCNGRVVEYERLGDVPSVVECENHEGKPARHATAGNVWLRVGHHAPSPDTSQALQRTIWAGYACAVSALLFFIVLALLPSFGYPLSCEQRFPALVVLALASALAAAFLGSSATASGHLPMRRRVPPLAVGLTGGVAILVVILVLGTLLWARPCN